MAKTQHYDLYINDDGEIKFVDWRKLLAGENNGSNMVKIDKALHALEVKEATSLAETTDDGIWVVKE